MIKKRKNSVIAVIVCLIFTMIPFIGVTAVTKTNVQELKFNLGSEPKTIDPTMNSAQNGNIVIGTCFEGLTALDKNSKVIPGVAKSWEASKDGLVYTFHLRKDAKWSDGKPVTANDFYYSWTRLMNPKTAADYSYQTFYIKNAENYYKGKAKLSEVGLKVVDAYTLKIEVEAPAPYFPSLVASMPFAPERSDIVKLDPVNWSLKIKNYIGNGPYKLTGWKHRDQLTFEKNPYYWNAKNVKLGKLTYYEIEDNTSSLQAFEKGEIDVLYNTLPSSEMPRLIAEKKVVNGPTYATYYVELNTTRFPLNNVKFRQALSYAIDRAGIVTNILKGGQKPATGFVSYGSNDATGKDFRAYKAYETLPASPNLEKAKQLLAESGVDLSKVDIKYLFDAGLASNKKIAEIFQDACKQIGVNVELNSQESDVLFSTRSSGNFDICRSGWGGDYLDAMTFLDIWTTGNQNNNTKWSNPKYDELIDLAKKELNPATRMKELHSAEDILMNEMPCLPIYFYSNLACINPKIKGVYMLPTGGIYFDKAYKE